MNQTPTGATFSRRDVLRGFCGLAVALPLSDLTGRLDWALGAGPPGGKKSLAAVVRGNNQCAFDLYSRLRGQAGNLFLSPYSISTALHRGNGLSPRAGKSPCRVGTSPLIVSHQMV